MSFKSNLHMAFMAALAAMVGCSKDQRPATAPLASLNIVNATVNQGALKVNFTGKGAINYWVGITTTVSYGANSLHSINANSNVPIVIAPAIDSAHPIYSNTLSYANGSYYTLFLAGQTGAVDSLSIKESFVNYPDSAFGCRFINLSYNSPPISVNIKNAGEGFEVIGLAYKQTGGFKKYVATAAFQTYTFEIRDAASGTLLSTYVFQPTSPANPVPMHHNCTLAWIGQTGASGANAPKVQRINHY